MPPTPFYPRGHPLTESMPLTDADGVCWLAYVEAVPASRPPRRQDRVTLPGRRLRFDSATEARTTTPVPAGSPFLSDARLRRLLDAAQPVPPPPPSRRSSDVRRHPVIELASRAEELGSVLADPSRPRRRTGGSHYPTDSGNSSPPPLTGCSSRSRPSSRVGGGGQVTIGVSLERAWPTAPARHHRSRRNRQAKGARAW